MRFLPRSEQDIDSQFLWPEGDYDFTCLEANDRISKSGNEMIELKLRVFDANGNERVIFDYLLEAMAHKLRHFCESTGLLSIYDHGDLQAQNCVGRNGICRLAVEPGGKYRPKNSVEDYVVKQKDIKRPTNTAFTPDSPPARVCPPGIDPITGVSMDGIDQESGIPF